MSPVHQVWPKPFCKAQLGGGEREREREREREDEADGERGGKATSGNDRPGVRQVQEGSGKKGKMEETGCEVICGAPTTLAVEGWMIMMMMMMMMIH